MGDRYHPIYEALWADTKFARWPDPWLHRAFFSYLCSHHRTAPAGIYAVTPEILAAETGRPLKWVQESLGRASGGGLVRVADGVLWVVKYLERQPNRKGEAYQRGVVSALKRLGLAHQLCQEFLATYKTLGRPLADPRLRLGRASLEAPPHPPSGIRHPPSPTEKQEQEKAVGAEPTETSAPAHPQDNGLPEWFREALKQSPHFQALAAGHAKFWRAMSAAYDPYEWLKWDEEIQKADAWIAANPQRKPRALPRFLRNWFERTVERQRKEQRAQTTK